MKLLSVIKFSTAILDGWINNLHSPLSGFARESNKFRNFSLPRDSSQCQCRFLWLHYSLRVAKFVFVQLKVITWSSIAIWKVELNLETRKLSSAWELWRFLKLLKEREQEEKTLSLMSCLNGVGASRTSAWGVFCSMPARRASRIASARAFSPSKHLHIPPTTKKSVLSPFTWIH